MTTELPSIGYRCLLCGKVLTELENNHAIGELDRIISERTNEQVKAFEKQYDKISEERLNEKEQEIQKKDRMLEEKDRQLEELRTSSQIMGPNRQLLDTVIVYDNKNTQRIDPDDVRKSKSYKEIHNTDYSIIVSRNIPKEYSANGRYAEKDGVIIINPELLEPVVGNIRRGLIEISKMSNNKQGMLTKQSKLFSYITGQEFRRQLEAFYSVHTRLTTLQDDEEKRHKTLWKKRTEVYEDLKERYTNISSGLDAILNDTDLVSGDYVSP